MEDIMLDLETMGKSSNAAIVAIGAVEFDPSKHIVGSRFYMVVDLESSVHSGGVMDPSTVLWWLKQDDAARSAFDRVGEPIEEALRSFSRWADSICYPGSARVWGNGAVFDNVILANAYQRAKIHQPWEYYNDRCYRTIKQEHPEIKMERRGTHHNAVDDAESQAWHLMDMLRERAASKQFRASAKPHQEQILQGLNALQFTSIGTDVSAAEDWVKNI